MIMARYGVNVLLTKYNNPINLSPRILINTKSYYHPYELYCHTVGYDEVLTNATMINDYKLELNRCTWYLTFVYTTKAYTITFTCGRRIKNITIRSYTAKAMTHNIYIYRWFGEDEFRTDYPVPDGFNTLIDSMKGTTLAEIYQKYLPNLVELIQDNWSYFK